jgi:hypothetical protein
MGEGFCPLASEKELLNLRGTLALNGHARTDVTRNENERLSQRSNGTAAT